MGLPAAMPLTLQVTLVSVAPVTVAVKGCALPKRSDAVAGVTLMLTEDAVGVGGGGWTTAETPLQPAVNEIVTTRTRSGNAGE